MNQSRQSNHIQIPASILKEFSTVEHKENTLGFYEKLNKIYRMNMHGEIDYVNIDECNAQIGYYTQTKEDELQKIESAFGDVKKKIKQASKNKLKSVRLSTAEYRIIKKFFMLSLSRSQRYIKSIKRYMIFGQFASGNLNEILMSQIEQFDILDDFVPSLIEIQGNSRFVLTQFYWYHFSIKSTSFAVMPITPTLAIVLTKNLSTDSDTRGHVDLLHSRIDDMNRIAILEEFNDNHQAVYAKSKEDLEKYVQYLKGLTK